MSRLLALLVVLAAPAEARAEAACEAWTRLEPAQAFVGQQVIHRQIIERREGPAPEWSQPLRFPGFRVEKLASDSTAVREGPGGAAHVRVESVTALFPVRAGHWRLPDGRLRCGDEEVVVPGPAFEARPWPEAGRPTGFTGVVGAVTLALTAEETVPLGGSVRVHLTSRGKANLWAAEPALALDPPDTEVFRREPRIALRGDQVAHAVRHDVFDLVPRRAGELRIAPVRIVYLEPASGAYRTAATAARRIRVLPGPAATDAAGRPADRASGRPAAAGRSGRVGLTAICGALLSAGLLAWLLRVRRRADPLRAALREADRAENPRARAAALERALRARLAAHGQGPIGSTPEALLERSPDTATGACARALADLERARFDGTGRAADLDAIRALLASGRRP